MTVKLIGSYNDSCDDTHISKHIKKDTPLSDVPTYNIVLLFIISHWNLSYIDIIYHTYVQYIIVSEMS